jgi:hypothetical protein
LICFVRTIGIKIIIKIIKITKIKRQKIKGKTVGSFS